MKKKLILALTIISLCISSISCSKSTTNVDDTNNNVESTNSNVETTNNSSNNLVLDEELGDITATISLGNAINTSGDGVSVNNNTVTITTSGTYEINGTSSDAQIIVDNASEENVYLVLNNMNQMLQYLVKMI